jgi:hypothetical protein
MSSISGNDLDLLDEWDLYRTPRRTVYQCSRLGDEWTEVPFLQVDWCTRVAAPAVDEARLSYDYGPVIREDGSPSLQYEPLALEGKYIKIEIEAQTADGISVDPITWYGICEGITTLIHGSSDGNPRGRQTFTCYGLLHLLDRVHFNATAVYENSAEITLAWGLPFNVWDMGEIPERGNRSASVSGSTYVFSLEPEQAEEWTAWTAAEYLLAHHAPVGLDEAPICNWRLVGDETAVSWYRIDVNADGRTVKSLLDEFIPFRRGVSYWVTYDEGLNEVQVQPFTIFAETVVLDDGRTIAANPDQLDINLEDAQLIQRCELRTVNTAKYHRIRVQGEFKTSTATLDFGLQQEAITRGWTNVDETAYKRGGQDEPSYYVRSPREQYRVNAEARSSDALAHVFARFVVHPEWNQIATLGRYPGSGLTPFVFPLLDEDGEVIERSPSVTESEVVSNAGLRILPRLALYERWDYSADHIADGTFRTSTTPDQPQQRGPLILVPTEGDPSSIGSDTNHYQNVEHLALCGYMMEHVQRDWSCEPQLTAVGPGLDIRVRGGPQHLIARSSWSGAAATDPDHEPRHRGGLNWQTFIATLTLQADTRVTAEIVLTAPEDGEQERIKLINVADARLDYVVPGTVVDSRWGGELVVSDSGGFVRDDRDRLQAIARGAAEFYGRTRQTLSLQLKNLNYFNVGTLITDFGASYHRQGINTVISAVRWEFDGATVLTSVETAYPEFDLA